MSVEPKPAGTVVVLREVAERLELLLLERTFREPGARFGASVFPGGRVEAEDVAQTDGDPQRSAHVAAIREAREEAGLDLAGVDLAPISRWITPAFRPRRFDAWFFLAAVPASVEVRVDGSEICRHRWLTPRAALEAKGAGEIELAPPTFVTVTWLSQQADVRAAFRSLEGAPVLTFRPRLCKTPEGRCMLYPGDAGYEDEVFDRPGARHRLWLHAEGWSYERTI